MKTTVEVQQKKLLIKFHTLCNRAGLRPDEKEAIIASYGHFTSQEMSLTELIDAVTKLDEVLNPQLLEMDVWRKRVIASIGGYLKVLNKEQNIQIIKSIACRATDHTSFNAIPKARLINIYYAFTKKQKDFKAIGEITDDIINELIFQN
ncbi:MAG: hypothetical protein PHZ24_14310 [Bacteroidales bacterium]|nr:hypothetical protein [Bacteroidales bacterium]